MRSRRRTALALLLSLIVHVAVLVGIFWLLRKPATERPKPPPLRIVLVPQKAPPKKVAPPGAVKAPAATPKSSGSLAQAPATKPAAPAPKRLASAPPSERAPAAKPATPATPEAHAPSTPPVASAPRELHLLPNPAPFLAQGPSAGEESHGHTTHNSPDELPDPQAVAEVQAQEAKRKVDGWIGDELASARVENGLVDSYFSDMHRELQKQTEKLPVEKEGNIVQQMVKSWLSAGQNYGKSGNPYGPGMGPDPHVKGGIPTALEQQAERFRGSSAEKFQQQLEMGARLREFADGRFGGVLTAVVEIRQDPRGKLLSALLVESSGNKQFDNFVIQRAPIAIEKVPPAPEKGAGIHPDGIRSTWAFEGRITYKKSAKKLNLADDGWYLLGAGALGLLSGTFDEVNGTMDVVDLRNPEFTCKVRLLKVY